ncbi:hypothetical protein BU23DRAFT_633750 [Bimuria novae-zelandiae CBS 107.79]|uniref:Uncharacterized protein n=1 Tax=Bimuria novae-zelandiae CBS 107.79 TaxID=1447943 RepID=A0A6A5VFS9_9PLEO|nr:hypothetical protein BU23DRAFT_633750 [Bimuria novae-zelandiae CBS 107.79]
MTLSTKYEFIAHHLHNCEAPAGINCTICQEQADNSEQATRIDHANGSSCFFHKECALAWFNSVDEANVVQRTRAQCPNDRIELFQPARIIPARFIWTAEINAAYRSDDLSLEEMANRADAALRVIRSTRANLETVRGIVEDYHERIYWRQAAATHYEALLAAEDNPEYNALGRELRDEVDQWTTEYAQMVASLRRSDIARVRRHITELEVLGITDPQIPRIENRVRQAEDLLNDPALAQILASDNVAVGLAQGSWAGDLLMWYEIIVLDIAWLQELRNAHNSTPVQGLRADAPLLDLSEANLQQLETAPANLE